MISVVHKVILVGYFLIQKNTMEKLCAIIQSQEIKIAAFEIDFQTGFANAACVFRHDGGRVIGLPILFVKRFSVQPLTKFRLHELPVFRLYVFPFQAR